MHSKAASLIYCQKLRTKSGKKNNKKVKMDMLKSIGNSPGNWWSQSWRRKQRLQGKDLQKRKVLSLDWKSGGVMDDESDESMKLMEEVPLKELGDAELERLVRGWRREAGSWFQRQGEAYWKEWSVIRRADDVDGRASVTKDEKWLLRGGWTVIRLCR